MFSDFIDHFKTRLSSPLLMSIFVSFVLINWQAFYYLIFSGTPTISSVDNWWIKSKFSYWDEYMNWWRYLLPVPIGLAYVFFGPKLSIWVAKVVLNDISEKRALETRERAEILDLEAELLEARKARFNAEVDELIKTAEQKSRVNSLPDDTLREDLQKQIDALKSQNVELETKSTMEDPFENLLKEVERLHAAAEKAKQADDYDTANLFSDRAFELAQKIKTIE